MSFEYDYDAINRALGQVDQQMRGLRHGMQQVLEQRWMVTVLDRSGDLAQFALMLSLKRGCRR